jgi:hypothetical protein
LDEALALDEELKNAKDLTVDEMKAAGRKNIVETPTDDAFAKALKTRSEKLHESEDEDDDVPRRKRGKKSREQGMTSNQLEGDAAQ